MNTEIDSIIFFPDTLSINNGPLIELVESEPDKFLSLISYDTIFTVLTTISIFITGVVINEFLKRRTIKTEQKQIKLYFKTFLDRIVDEYLCSLSKLYKDFYIRTDIDSGMPSNAPKVLSGDFERIKNIDGEKLFHSIKNKESLSNIFNQIDYLEKLNLEIAFYHKHVRSVSDSIRNPMQKLLNDYFDTLAKFIEHVRISNPSYPGCQEFSSLVNESVGLYHNELSRTRQIRKVYKDIIRPIQVAVVESNIFRNDALGLEIANQGKELSLQYSRLRRFSIEIRLSYRSFYNHVNKSKSKLEVEREKINWR